MICSFKHNGLKQLLETAKITGVHRSHVRRPRSLSENAAGDLFSRSAAL